MHTQDRCMDAYASSCDSSSSDPLSCERACTCSCSACSWLYLLGDAHQQKCRVTSSSVKMRCMILPVLLSSKLLHLPIPHSAQVCSSRAPIPPQPFILQFKILAMLAGGFSITVCLQVCHAIAVTRTLIGAFWCSCCF